MVSAEFLTITCSTAALPILRTTIVSAVLTRYILALACRAAPLFIARASQDTVTAALAIGFSFLNRTITARAGYGTILGSSAASTRPSFDIGRGLSIAVATAANL